MMNSESKQKKWLNFLAYLWFQSELKTRWNAELAPTMSEMSRCCVANLHQSDEFLCWYNWKRIPVCERDHCVAVLWGGS